MDAKSHLTRLFQEALKKVAPEAADTEIHLERPRDPTHGDWATNVALQLARRLKRKPRELADLVVDYLRLEVLGKDSYVDSMEVAGAGFINIRLKESSKTQIVRQILDAGATFGRGKPAKARKIQV